MFNKDKALQQLKKLFATSPVRVIPATVLSIESNACTVQPIGSDLQLFDVGLFADTQHKGVGIAPKINSLVLIGFVGEKLNLDKLYICQVLDGDTVRLPVGDFTVELTETSVVVTGPLGQIELTPTVLASLFVTANPVWL